MIESWGFLIVSFLIGAIPFGFLVARAKGIDIRQVGSGNSGATNVGRTLGKTAGIAVLLLDTLKGVVPSLLAGVVITEPFYGLARNEYALFAGLAAIVGHMFSPFLKFKGGKGIATGLGVLIANAPLVALSVLVAFAVVMALSRWVSLSSLAATVTMVVSAWLFGYSPVFLIVFGVMAVAIFYRHRENIARIIKGTEPKFKFADKKAAPAPEGNRQ